MFSESVGANVQPSQATPSVTTQPVTLQIQHSAQGTATLKKVTSNLTLGN